MAIRKLKLKVVRSQMHQIVADFPEWEKPILEAMHEAVEVLGEVVVNRDPPNPAEEYERLTRRYGRSENEDGSRGIPYVGAVYGQHGPGIAALGRAIKEATVDAAPESAEDLVGAV